MSFVPPRPAGARGRCAGAAACDSGARSSDRGARDARSPRPASTRGEPRPSAAPARGRGRASSRRSRPPAGRARTAWPRTSCGRSGRRPGGRRSGTCVEQGLRGADERGVRGEEDDRATRRSRAGRSQRAPPGVPRPVPPSASRTRPAAIQESASCARLKTMRSAGRRRIRSASSDDTHLHDHDLRDAVDEQHREGERRREGLLADLAVHLDREQLAEQDERGEDPELSFERADVARADEAQRDDRDSTGDGYEPQVKREGGKLARHWSESRRGGTLQAWANRDAALPSSPVRQGASRAYGAHQATRAGREAPPGWQPTGRSWPGGLETYDATSRA